MSAGLLFLLLCSAAIMAFGTAACVMTDGPQGRPIALRPMLLPAAMAFATIVVATAISQWLGHQHQWGVALNRVSYAVLIGCVVGLLAAVWIVAKPAWCRAIVGLSARASANPGGAWLGATVVMVAFVAGALSRS